MQTVNLSLGRTGWLGRILLLFLGVFIFAALLIGGVLLVLALALRGLFSAAFSPLMNQTPPPVRQESDPPVRDVEVEVLPVERKRLE